MRRIVAALALSLALAAGLLTVARDARTADAADADGGARRLVVLGIDGLDPVLLARFMEEGAMPAFSALARRGGMAPLATSTPPQSPVAWSDFITGTNPGAHGVFDFIALDRKTLVPYLSTSRIEEAGSLPLGRYRIPLGGARTVLLRDGRAFWEILDEHDVRSTIFRIPANYPPVAASGGALSGMGTPDLQGSPGTFAFFTDELGRKAERVSGGRISQVILRDGSASARLEGPSHPFDPEAGALHADFDVHVDPEHPLAEIRIADERVVLGVGEWSGWLPVHFEALPVVATVSGMVRFYLKGVRPLRLYASPINIDPANPAQEIAAPASYAPELAEAVGPFYTQEMPEDTKALSAHVLTPREFLAQSGLVFAERQRLLRHELARFLGTLDSDSDSDSDASARSAAASQPGLLFFYVSSIDQRSHMLWRHIDAAHPNHDVATPRDLAESVRTSYLEVDALLAEAVDAIGSSDVELVVMSDHGFAPFRRQAHLNAWLERHGYLTLRQPADRSAAWLTAVDWSRTRAFAIGLNSLYLNVRGRERSGIVAPQEREALAAEIAQGLRAWRDGEAVVVSRPLLREQIYSGAHTEGAPDILVGYARGYRASWPTTRGEVPDRLIDDNTHEWSGDHCMDATAVPGVVVSSLPILRRDGGLRDLTVSVLGYFGVDAPPEMKGRSIF